jgi:enoyl-CoA hydratase
VALVTLDRSHRLNAMSHELVGSLHAGIDLENRTQVMTAMTEDMREAVTAFVETRPPTFGGR